MKLVLLFVSVAVSIGGAHATDDSTVLRGNAMALDADRSLKVVENFLTAEELSEFMQVEATVPGYIKGWMHGETIVPSTFLHRLKQAGAVQDLKTG